MSNTELLDTRHMFIKREDNISSYQVRVQDMKNIFLMIDTLKDLITYEKNIENPIEVDNCLKVLKICLGNLNKSDICKYRDEDNYVFLPELKIPDKPNNIVKALGINSNDNSSLKIKDVEFGKMLIFSVIFNMSYTISNEMWEDLARHQYINTFIGCEKKKFVNKINHDISEAILLLERYLHALDVMFPCGELYNARKYCTDLIKWLNEDL